MHPPPHADPAERAAHWRRGLGLSVLEGESGWWAPVSRSRLQVGAAGGPTAASSCIYYLLDAARPVNVWHWLASEDTHVLIEGGPVDYVLLPDGQPARREVLGRDLVAGHRPVISAPAGSWKALRLTDPTGYALVATVVSPAWSPEHVRIGLPDTVRATRTDSEPWLTTTLIDALDRP